MENVQNVLLIVNPNAGNSPKDDLISFIDKEANQRNFTFTLYNTKSEKKNKPSVEELLLDKKFDRVLIAGGDGTIHKMIPLLLKHKIPVGIFPEGSANGLATNLNLPSDYRDLLDIALDTHFINLDALQINEWWSIHIADFGVNAELIKNFKGTPVRGLLGYVIQSIPTLINSEYPFNFEISTQGKTYIKKGVVLAIANGIKYGTGATINPEGKLNDGNFEIVIFKNLDAIEIIKTLTNKHTLNADFAETISTKEATIVCKEAVPFQSDGEYMGKVKQVTVSVLRDKLRVAVPKSA